MEPMVLVTYATRNGSTKEVADAGSRNAARAWTRSGMRACRGRAIAGWILGSCVGVPLYMSRLHKDARRFLDAHREAMMKLPVALFVLGPVQPDAKDWTGAQKQLEKELKKYAWLSPVALRIFGGKFDPAKLGFPFTLIPPLRKMKAMDVRDWDAIHAWAVDVGMVLLPVPRV